MRKSIHQQRSSTDQADEKAAAHHSSKRRYWRRLQSAIIGAFLLYLIAVQPALAQSNAICNADKLPGMVEGFFQITTTLGIVGLAVVWQADALFEMFTLSPEQKKGLKRHKRSALKSAVILLALGPLYTVAGSMMGLPLAECVDLTPW